MNECVRECMPVKAWRNSAPAIVVEVNMLNSEFLLNQRPDVGDAHAARAWLRELPLTDTRAAHHALESLLDAFDDNALSLRKRLDILETVRAQRVEIDAQYARRYVDKPLPLAEAERAACTHALGASDKMTPDPRFEALGDHLTFIEQIEEDIARFKTRLEHIADKRLRRNVLASIRREQMRRLERSSV